jgi:hypothetical protein
MASGLTRSQRRKPATGAVFAGTVCLLVLLATFLAAAHDTDSCPEGEARCALCQLAKASWQEPPAYEFTFQELPGQHVFFVAAPLPPAIAVTVSYCPRAPPHDLPS